MAGLTGNQVKLVKLVKLVKPIRAAILWIV